MSTRRVSFALRVTVIEAAPKYAAVREQTLQSSPAPSEPAPMDIQLHEPVCTLTPEEDSRDASPVVVKPYFSSLPVPPGFEKFTWSEIPRGPGGIPLMFDFSADLPGWSPVGISRDVGDLPSLPVSPIRSNSPDVAVDAVSQLIFPDHWGAGRSADVSSIGPELVSRSFCR